MSQFLTDHDEIRQWLTRMRITNFTIKGDDTVDVNGVADISWHKLTILPVKFNNVLGDFRCNGNKLSSFNGFPSYIGGSLDICQTEFTSLEDCPAHISQKFTHVRY